MATGLQAQGRLDEAITYYQRALTHRATHAPAYNNMGTALRAQGRIDEAIVQYRRALELLSPRGVILIDNVLWDGEVLCDPPLDDRTAAIQELNRVVTADPRVTAVLATIRDGIWIITRTPSSL